MQLNEVCCVSDISFQLERQCRLTYTEEMGEEQDASAEKMDVLLVDLGETQRAVVRGQRPSEADYGRND